MTKGKVMSGLLVLVFLLSSCTSTGSTDELAGTKWQLSTMDGSALPEQVIITIEFKDGQAGGSSGCNSYGGAYEAEDGKITLDNIAATLMACADEQVMQAEQQYLQALGKVQKYQLQDGLLELMDENGNILLTFTPG